MNTSCFSGVTRYQDATAMRHQETFPQAYTAICAFTAAEHQCSPGVAGSWSLHWGAFTLGLGSSAGNQILLRETSHLVISPREANHLAVESYMLEDIVHQKPKGLFPWSTDNVLFRIQIPF